MGRFSQCGNQKALTLTVLAGVFVVNTRNCVGAGVGTCEPEHRLACDTAYLDCRLSEPADDQDAICGCAAIYYGACLPAAGCAASDEMTSCINDLMKWDCPEMSICGNDCTVDDGLPVLPEDTIILPVNNFGSNYLQLSVCAQGVSSIKLRQFGQISVGRCSDEDDSFHVCDLWVAPHTLTAVAFPSEVTYVRMEQCVLTTAASSLDTESSEESEESGECLDSVTPLEYYGTPLLWPSSMDVDYSTATLCEKDDHCPGSFCDLQQQPRTCAPKLEEHFSKSGSHFIDPRWELLELST